EFNFYLRGMAFAFVVGHNGQFEYPAKSYVPSIHGGPGGRLRIYVDHVRSIFIGTTKSQARFARRPQSDAGWNDSGTWKGGVARGRPEQALRRDGSRIGRQL